MGRAWWRWSATPRRSSQDLRAIRDAILEARGGWKTLAVLSSISAGAGALAAKIATVLGMLPK
ncbi:hypothetical protein HW532_21555 [Kaustia mangrovi]|uniref:Uncharacterized protein n=1 Tax=Kaustia mangrovi TaxID=2593653 RepID=A0A7S8C7Y9_9HYPH|nr:hypothetical protein [Kaustia mangrovi]QPC45054.1 hypothetical protein HW532_21555 [Kaustia mangrovi]